MEVIEFLIENVPKFLKLAEDIESVVEHVSDPHEKSMLLELVDVIEEVYPRLDSILQDLKELA